MVKSFPVLDQVQVVGSPAECLSFPPAVTLESFGVTRGAMHIRSRGAERWPAVAIEEGGEPVQAGTLWLLLPIGDKWMATGAERLRPTQVNGDKPEVTDRQDRIEDLIGKGWLYDENRWPGMTGYTPAQGSPVGVMLVSGSTRSDNQMTVRERSNILVVAWDNEGAQSFPVLWREGQGNANQQPLPEIPPPPAQEPTSPTNPAPVMTMDSHRWDILTQLLGSVIEVITAEGQKMEQKIAELERKFDSTAIVLGNTSANVAEALQIARNIHSETSGTKGQIESTGANIQQAAQTIGDVAKGVAPLISLLKALKG